MTCIGGAPGELRGGLLWVWWWWWRDHILGVGWILEISNKISESVYRISNLFVDFSNPGWHVLVKTVNFGGFGQKTPKMAKNPKNGGFGQIRVLIPKSDILGGKIARIIFGSCPLKGGFLKTRFKTPNNAIFSIPPHPPHNHHPRYGHRLPPPRPPRPPWCPNPGLVEPNVPENRRQKNVFLNFIII